MKLTGNSESSHWRSLYWHEGGAAPHRLGLAGRLNPFMRSALHHAEWDCSLQATVIGGGYIGMEVGAGLNKNGMDVTIVFPEKHLMERLFTPEIAQFYEKYYQDKGVTLKSGSLATEFKGKDGVVSLSAL